MVGQANEPAARADRRLVSLGFVGEAAGMDDQALAAGGREPIDAAHQVVDRFLVGRRVGRTQVDAGARMDLAAPAAVGAMDREPAIVDLASECQRVW